MQNVTKGYTPERVLYYFEEISKIPRESGDEDRISDYVLDTAKGLGLDATKDKYKNVFVKKPSHPSCIDKKPVIFQGHTDMVCVKDEGVKHNFAIDPLELYMDGDNLRARGTTLGADDGIACAYMLALMEDKDLVAPELHFLFTATEETGMDGAIGFDGRKLIAPTMINIDGGPFGIGLVGCAGGICADIFSPFLKVSGSTQGLKIKIGGLLGGHSGAEIHKQRGNSIKILARVLGSLDGLKIQSFNGGVKHNAIASTAEAVVAVDDIEKAKAVISELQGEIRKELPSEEKSFFIETEDAEANSVFSKEDSKRITGLITALPNGVIAMSNEIPGNVEFSSNLGVAVTKGNKFSVEISPRSSKESYIKEIRRIITVLCEAFGFKYNFFSSYPGWEVNENSHVKNVFQESFKKLFDEDMKVTSIHAGLECGILQKKAQVPMDIISIGPELHDYHTPNEYLNLPSCKKLWDLILDVLKNI